MQTGRLINVFKTVKKPLVDHAEVWSLAVMFSLTIQSQLAVVHICLTYLCHNANIEYSGGSGLGGTRNGTFLVVRLFNSSSNCFFRRLQDELNRSKTKKSR